MTEKKRTLKAVLRKEVALLTGLLFIGLVLVPVAIYMVGQAIFGAYGGQGFAHFYGTLSGKLRSGDTVAWFLVFSPYLAWQCLRLTALAWRYASRIA